MRGRTDTAFTSVGTLSSTDNVIVLGSGVVSSMPLLAVVITRPFQVVYSFLLSCCDTIRGDECLPGRGPPRQADLVALGNGELLLLLLGLLRQSKAR